MPLVAQAVAPLKLGILSFRPEAQMMTEWQPLADYLSQQINHPIQLTAYSYQDLETAVEKHQVDLIITNSAHYVLIAARHSLSGPLATMIRFDRGHQLSHFGGVMFMRADQPEPKTLPEIASKRLVAVSLGSFGGYQMQAMELFKAGIQPRELDLFTTGMPHDAVVQAVLDGKAEVGFVRTGVLEDMIDEGRLQPGLVKVIRQYADDTFPLQRSTPLYPEWPVVMMPQLDDDLSRKIIIALLSLQPDSVAATSAGIYGFTRPADYTPVESLLRGLRLPPFEQAPDFTVLDMWHKHWPWIMALSLLFVLLLMAGARLSWQKRQIEQSRNQLAEFSRNFEAFLNQTTDLVYFKDQQGCIVFCSQTLAELAGVEDWHSLVGRSTHDLLEDCLQSLQTDNKLLTSGAPVLNWVEPCQQGEQTQWMMTNKWPLYDQQGQVVGVFGISRDITELKEAEARLKLLASVFTHAREGIIITDQRGDILDVNEAFSRITGYSREEVIGRNPRLLSSGRQGVEFYKAMWKELQQKGHWYGELWNRRKDGEVYAQMTTISAVYDEDGELAHYVGLQSDITTIKEHQKELEHIAHYDVLTSLPNRSLLGDRLQQAMWQVERNAKALAVVFLDLDGFKAINDSFGHEVGDQLLVNLAQKMKEALRRGDTLARIGGDEFVAVLTELHHPDEVAPLLQRLLEAASEPIEIDKQMLQVSASIGVTMYPLDSAEAEQLIRHADLAMYQAKQSGKNRFHFFDVERDRQVKNYRETQQRIEQALANDEFVLHYQPKVNMLIDEVVGVEALIRWQHPERGLLPPAEFLPLIENHPLSVMIDEWVLDQALNQLAEWHAQGHKLSISVNICARMLQQVDFVERLKARLMRYDRLPAHSLELEVLETSALEDMGHVSRVIRLCEQLGVHFALDDFGTGYSSLAYLRHLPAQMIKIDQSFVRDMLVDPDDLAIVGGVVGLASAFHRQVIAEGVETVEHGELLLLMGCELAQGYGIAKPMHAQDFIAWSQAWQPDPLWRVWAGREIRNIDLTLLLAEVEHRSWIAHLEQYLQGTKELPPQMDEHRCNFGRWFDTHGKRRHADDPRFKEIDQLHHDVHHLAAELIDAYQQGQKNKVTEQLPRLYNLRDKLIERLRELMQKTLS